MKHVALPFAVLLLGILTLVPSAQAQTLPEFKPPRALHFMQPFTAAKTAATYRPSESISLVNDELNWINQTRTRNHFGEGLLRSKMHEIWEGHVFGDWAPSVREDYTYSDNLLTQTIFFDHTGTDWVGRTRMLYEYENGTNTRVTTQQHTGNGVWVDEERTTLTLSHGNISGGLIEVWEGAAWVPTERFNLVEENRAVVQTYQLWDGAQWVNTERLTYEGLTIALLYEWFQRFLTEFSDYEGLIYSLRLPDTVQQQWDGGTWVNVARQLTDRYLDYQTGAPLEEDITLEEWDGESWIPTSRLAIEYAHPSTYPQLVGLPAKTSFQMFGDTTWINLLTERYILQNSIRRIVQATVESDLGEGPQEVTQVRINWTDISTAVDPGQAPRQFVLDQNVPNPFHESTRIAFRLEEPQHVRLSVYDMLGRTVAVLADEHRPRGEQSVSWEAAHLASGVYIYRLEAGSQVETRRMVLLK